MLQCILPSQISLTMWPKKQHISRIFRWIQSFCEKHVPEMPVKKAARAFRAKHPKVFYGTAMIRCRLCLDVMPARGRDIVWSTCCPNAYFHFKCVQEHALKAGNYHFRCPLCNDEKVFVPDCLANGIYVPIRDAVWEVEDEHDELLARPENCSAPACYCPRGSKYDSDFDADKRTGEKWALEICNTCGSIASHIHCAKKTKFGQLTYDLTSDEEMETNWTCADCYVSEQRSKYISGSDRGSPQQEPAVSNVASESKRRRRRTSSRCGNTSRN